MPSENTVNCHIKDGVNYSGFNLIQKGGGGTSGQLISYAEWLQLTPEEQNNGEYFIPDFPTSALSPSGGFDTEPKLGSIKPVTSDGIARAMRVDTNPIGTVLALMGLTAPYGYLICDGTTYNIEDYPELADYFADQFGSVNKFGGNGTTTFAVPDLRGEFLRGVGNNSHTNQGNGGTVGEHQDSTEILGHYQNKTNAMQVSGNDENNIRKSDKMITSATSHSATYNGESKSMGGNSYTVRPTNTSVNFIIKAVNSPASAQQQLDMHNRYSTEETWTGKYWIDGKKIYRKVIDVKISDMGSAASYQKYYIHGISGIERVITIKGSPVVSAGYIGQPLIPISDSSVNAETGYSVSIDSTYIYITMGTIAQSRVTKMGFIIEYTKTT